MAMTMRRTPAGSDLLERHWLTLVMVVLCIVFLAVLVAIGPAGARDLTGKWAQADPGVQKWFNEQLVPGGERKGGSCCQISDGVNAEERWRGGGYEAKFTVSIPENGSLVQKQVPWTSVPAEAVLSPPFPRSLLQPIVWWYYLQDKNTGTVSVLIRCYKPEEKGN